MYRLIVKLAVCLALLQCVRSTSPQVSIPTAHPVYTADGPIVPPDDPPGAAVYTADGPIVPPDDPPPGAAVYTADGPIVPPDDPPPGAAASFQNV